MTDTLKFISFYNDYSELNFYLPLDELERATLERFSMLTALSIDQNDTSLRGKSGIHTYPEFQRDIGSHYLLRYAFCGTDENRQWFVEQEKRLFVERIKALSIKDIATFINSHSQYFNDYKHIVSKNDLPNPDMDERDINTINRPSAQAPIVPISSYFRVPFEDALYLVRTKSVFLSRGYAIVQLRDLVNIIGTKFRTVLSKSMNDTFRYYQEMKPRLARFSEVLEFTSKKLNFVEKSNVYASDTRVTHIADIEELCTKSYPLCMRHLHKALVKDNHLRFYGRLQYAMYLKGLGVPVDELQEYWRSKFSKYAQTETKLRPYIYMIRHIYGLEGKGTDYTPYGCIKIGSLNVMTGEHHGCPFNMDQHSMEVLSRELLEDLKVSKQDADEIMELCYSHQYQLACGKYFKAKHPDSIEFGVNHPNTYAYESRKYWKENSSEGSSDRKKSLNVRKTLMPIGNGNNDDSMDDINDEELLNIPYEEEEGANENATTKQNDDSNDIEMK